MAPKEIRRQEFGRDLWALMLRRGMSQSDLARRAGLGRDSISGYVRGRNLPEPRNAKKMADALGVTVHELYPGATENAMDTEHPAIEMRQAVGQPGKAWLRVNRLVSFSTAAKIVALLEADKV